MMGCGAGLIHSATSGPRDAPAGEHRPGGKEPLAPRDRVLVVVHELEGPFAQFEQRDIGWRAHVERATVVEYRKDTRGVYGRARDRLTDRHAIAEQLRHAVGQVDD